MSKPRKIRPQKGPQEAFCAALAQLVALLASRQANELRARAEGEP